MICPSNWVFKEPVDKCDNRNLACCGSVHGNRHCQREKNNITTTKVLFEQYVKDFGESVPNQQTRRLKDGQLVHMSPMNVRRVEIWLTINLKLRRFDELGIGLPTFHSM